MSTMVQKIKLEDDKQIECITLVNENGIEVEVLTLGSIIKSIKLPTKEGIKENILLEYKNLQDYVENPMYLNTVVGRTAGRIALGRITIGNQTYQLNKNKGEHTLHGGDRGFHTKVWEYEILEELESVGVALNCTSEDGEAGYPGKVKIKVTYRLDNDNCLFISYEALSDKDTILNLTNHAYYNLSGDGKRDILDHEVEMKASQFLELDESSVPTGVTLSVDRIKAFDFRKGKALGRDINMIEPELEKTGGYDHPWILDTGKEAIVLSDAVSGRRLTFSTDQEAVVMYTMNYETTCELTNGLKNVSRYGVCFEEQALPIGRDECFKDGSLLKKDQVYKHQTQIRIEY